MTADELAAALAEHSADQGGTGEVWLTYRGGQWTAGAAVRTTGRHATRHTTAVAGRSLAALQALARRLNLCCAETVGGCCQTALQHATRTGVAPG